MSGPLLDTRDGGVCFCWALVWEGMRVIEEGMHQPVGGEESFSRSKIGGQAREVGLNIRTEALSPQTSEVRRLVWSAADQEPSEYESVKPRALERCPGMWVLLTCCMWSWVTV